MHSLFIKFNTMSFEYPEAPSSLFDEVNLHLTTGWTGLVGANGTGKTTLLKLATGLLQPSEGNIQKPQHVIYCEQRTDNMPTSLPHLMEAKGKEAHQLIEAMGVDYEWVERWDTLSHGERKRAQIATALWQVPDLLAIDEPTNHVDTRARDLLLASLQKFKGIGLLVSHDRKMLDTLCDHCVFIDPPDITLRPGGYSQGVEANAMEQRSARKDRDERKRVYRKLKREAVQRRKLADQHAKLKSKRGISPKDHDAKAKVDMARLSGKDVTGGKLLRQIDKRLSRAENALRGSKVKKEQKLGIWLPGSISQRDYLLSIPPTHLQLGQRNLEVPELAIGTSDRIGITGLNGAGKSTLLASLIPQLNIPEEHLTYIPQEISADESEKIMASVHKLPHGKLGHVMTIISRLGSEPDRLLESVIPSPGETRKLLLALGMTRLPHMIIMDEPTNHMDLPSIDCLEAALSECPCALLLVSHDERFLNSLTLTNWDIRRTSSDSEKFTLVGSNTPSNR